MAPPSTRHTQDPAIGSTVGIVVIGRNEGALLVECLASLRARIDHVVYVDSGSTDDSTASARIAGAQVVELDASRPFSAARARNAGFQALQSRGVPLDFVQFVDGDCVVAPDWIETGSRFLACHPDIAVVCGRRRERLPDRSVYNALCDQEWNGPIGDIRECGGDFMVRVAPFVEVGGFNPHFIAGEEPELCVRLREKGWTIWRLASEMTVHDANILQFFQWWKRTVRGGHAFAEVGALHRSSPQRIWQRNIQRAVFWGGGVPATVLATSVFGQVSLLLLLIYPAQWMRLVIRSGDYTWNGCAKAGLLLLGKFAELQGMTRFHARRLLKRTPRLIEYR